MKYFDQYHLPTSLEEALSLLQKYQGRARVIAGGTDLLLDLTGAQIEGERPHYDALIDVTHLPGAREIRIDDDWVVIGCGVSHAQIVGTPAIWDRAAALAEACQVVGGPQVRNVATLIGNVAHALPAADGTIALLAMDAEAQVADSRKQRASQDWRPASALFLGPGQSAVDSTCEIITAVRFHPTGRSEGSAFARIMRPQGVALPILDMAVRLLMNEDRVERLAISAGPVAPTPFRASQTEDYLQGKPLTEKVLAEAKQILAAETGPRTSPHRATREYRQELLPGLLEQTLREAAARAQGKMVERRG